MRRLLYPYPFDLQVSLGLLLLRLAMGAAFLLHGWPKIQNPFGWMGPEAPFPGPLLFLAALSEFGGGIALLVGLLTRPAAVGLAATMAVAAGMVHIRAGHPFVPSASGSPSWELAAIYFACAVVFLLAGPGRFSLDAVVFGRPGDPAPAGK